MLPHRAISKLVQLIVAPGSLSVRGLDVLTVGLGASLGVTALELSALSLVHYCRLQAKELRSKLKLDPSTVGQREIHQWSNFKWLAMEFIALDDAFLRHAHIIIPWLILPHYMYW
jgi:hypothetical protein